MVAKSLDNDTDSLSVYLSGNGPLVEVLREALKKALKPRIKNVKIYGDGRENLRERHLMSQSQKSFSISILKQQSML